MAPLKFRMSFGSRAIPIVKSMQAHLIENPDHNIMLSVAVRVGRPHLEWMCAGVEGEGGLPRQPGPDGAMLCAGDSSE